jgi:AraC-like DNA-binding protein
MASEKIKTYSTESFRNKFMAPEIAPLLKPQYGMFFMVRVEEMLRTIQLPVPPVRSTIHTFIFLTQGEAILTIGSETYTIHANECLVVPAGQLYSFSNHDVNEGFICGLHTNFLAGRFGKQELLQTFEFLNSWGNPHIQPDTQASRYILRVVERIFEEYLANGLKNTNLVQSYCIALLYELNQVYTPLTHHLKARSVWLVNQFKDAVFRHIRTHHRVSEYATMLHVTPNHLNKVIKQSTGKSPTQWIDETLLLEAKALLYQTQFSISEVAAEIGIFDQSYFSRLFKKHEQVTPLQFRKMIEMS